MPGVYQIQNLLESTREELNLFAQDVLSGLSQEPKTIPSKYLYDEKGSELFKAISNLPEYYPTQCETAILEKRKQELVRLAGGKPLRILELGAGDARKSKILLQYFLEQGMDFEYILVDYCEEILQQAIASLKQYYNHTLLRVSGLAADYSSALRWLAEQDGQRNLVLFLGSSIGNFDPPQTHAFLQEIRRALKEEDLVFIGFDLKKDFKILEKAYSDSMGVTKAFNLNLLDRLNRDLGADFDRHSFVHHSFYNPYAGRMESWLLSKKSQVITFHKFNKSFAFKAWEGIQTECSYKYSLEEIDQLAKSAGFTLDHSLLDPKEYFADVIWEVKMQEL